MIAKKNDGKRKRRFRRQGSKTLYVIVPEPLRMNRYEPANKFFAIVYEGGPLFMSPRKTYIRLPHPNMHKRRKFVGFELGHGHDPYIFEGAKRVTILFGTLDLDENDDDPWHQLGTNLSPDWYPIHTKRRFEKLFPFYVP